MKYKPKNNIDKNVQVANLQVVAEVTHQIIDADIVIKGIGDAHIHQSHLTTHEEADHLDAETVEIKTTKEKEVGIDADTMIELIL